MGTSPYFLVKNRMANQPIAMHLIRKIFRLRSKGVSKLQMSRQLHLSRNYENKIIVIGSDISS